MKIIDKYLSFPYMQAYGAILSAVLTLLSAFKTLAILWTNEIGLLGDLLILVLGMAGIVAIIGSLFSLPALGEAVFEAGFRAAVEVGRTSLLIAQPFLWLTRQAAPAISYLHQAPKLPVETSLKHLSYYPPRRFSPFSTLPYEYYGVSRILLN